MLDRIVKGIDVMVRGAIYLALLVCGVSLAVLAAAVAAVGSWRVWQWLWKNLLGFEWGH